MITVIWASPNVDGLTAAAKNINLSIRFEDIRHRNLIGDAVRLRQVFMNLLSNSLRL